MPVKQTYPTKKVYAPCRTPYGRGHTAEEYEELRAAVEREIPFPVRVSVNEQRYVFGTVNISPVPINPRTANHWTQEEYRAVYDFMARHNLTISQPDLLQPDKVYVHSSGINYIYKGE
jgi:hypothetical protein